MPMSVEEVCVCNYTIYVILPYLLRQVFEVCGNSEESMAFIMIYICFIVIGIPLQDVQYS